MRSSISVFRDRTAKARTQGALDIIGRVILSGATFENLHTRMQLGSSKDVAQWLQQYYTDLTAAPALPDYLETKQAEQQGQYYA